MISHYETMVMYYDFYLFSKYQQCNPSFAFLCYNPYKTIKQTPYAKKSQNTAYAFWGYWHELAEHPDASLGNPVAAAALAIGQRQPAPQ